MDSSIPAWVAAAAVIVTNVGILSYAYGKLTQKVTDIQHLLNEHLHEHRKGGFGASSS